MIGGSYDGTTANMVAARGADAPGLAAIVPELAISRWYGYAYSGGVRYLGNSEKPSDEGFDTPLAFDYGITRTPPTQRTPQTARRDARPAEPVRRRRAHDQGLRHLARLRRLLGRAGLPQGRRLVPRLHARRARLAGLQRQAVRGRRSLRGAAAAHGGLGERAVQAPLPLPGLAPVAVRAPHFDALLDEFFATTLLGAAPGPELAAPVLTQGRTLRGAGRVPRRALLATGRGSTQQLALGRSLAGGTLGGSGGGPPRRSRTPAPRPRRSRCARWTPSRAGSPTACAPLAADTRIAGTPRLRSAARDRPATTASSRRRSSTSRPTAPPRRSRAASSTCATATGCATTRPCRRASP